MGALFRSLWKILSHWISIDYCTLWNACCYFRMSEWPRFHWFKFWNRGVCWACPLVLVSGSVRHGNNFSVHEHNEALDHLSWEALLFDVCNSVSLFMQWSPQVDHTTLVVVWNCSQNVAPSFSSFGCSGCSPLKFDARIKCLMPRSRT